jgi:hypothetical protein
MLRVVTRLPLLALGLVALGCAQHGGRLLVVIESDAALREVRVEAQGATTMEARFVAEAVPFSFVVEPTRPEQPIDLFVSGYPCDPETPACRPILRHERASVSANETRVLHVFLYDACVGRTCEPSECGSGNCTCGEGGVCVDVPVYRAVDLPLLPFRGAELDGGAADARGLDAPPMDAPELDAPIEPVDGPDAPEDTLVEFDGGADAPLDAGTDAPDAGTDAPLPTCEELYALSWGSGGYTCGETVCVRLAGTCCEFYTTNRCIDACDTVAGAGRVDDVWSRSGGSGSCAHGSIQSATDSNVICRCGRP